MKTRGVYLVLSLLLTFPVLLTSCSKGNPQQQTQQPTAPSRPSAQAGSSAGQSVQEPLASAAAQSESAASAPAGQPGGAAATEKHTLKIANYAGTAVTVTLNGEWVGQWDQHAEVPLDKVVQGKNQLVVELQDQPKNNLILEVYAQRSGNAINLLRLNFNGKPKASYNYTFVAR